MKYFTLAPHRPLFWAILSFSLLSNFASHGQLSISCPANITQDNDPGDCGAVVNYTPPVGTGTGTGLLTTLTLGLPSGSFFPVGVTQVRYTVTNDQGQSALCTFFITVQDVEDPVFDCPPNIIVNANPLTCGAVVNFSIPPVTDNCVVIDVYQSGGLVSGSVFPIGENSVNFEAIDSEVNLGLCRLQIDVIDVTTPTIVCPANIVVEVISTCSAVVIYTAPVGVEECTISNTLQTAGLGSGSNFPLGTTVETYTVTDLGGNTLSCSFNVTVVDIAPPLLSCPADISVNVAPGSCFAQVVFPPATVTDNCPGFTLVQTDGLPSGTNFPAGTTTIEYTATDGSGNVSVCSFNITVTENNPPAIVCPGNIVLNTDPGDCFAVVNYPVPVGTDDCAGAATVLISGLGSGANFPIGITTQEYSVTDASGNEATCSFTVTVTDVEAPVIDCPGTLNFPTSPGRCDGLAVFGIPTFTDNCPGGTIVRTAGQPSNSLFPVGITVMVYTVTDANGNVSICTFNVVINDEEDPVITCPANATFSIPSGSCQVMINYPNPAVSDNCPPATFALVSGPASGTMQEAGVYIIVFEASDAVGNTATCTFQITVDENDPPVFDCPGDVTVFATAGNCEASVTFPTPTATDLCSDVTVTQTGGPASGSVFPAGSTTVEFTAEDESGNTATCSFQIIVIDQVDPEISCPANIIQANDVGACGAIVTYDFPLGTDDCGIQSITFIGGIGSGNIFPIGNSVETYEIIDVSGNSATCSFEVLVQDTEAPVITCPDDILVENIPDGDCEAAVIYSLPVATDNCLVISVTLMEGPASGEMFPVGLTTVTYEATDNSGNSTSCSFSVFISENVFPEITCPADIIVPNDPNLCGAVVNYTTPVGTDNCGNASTVQASGLGSGATFPVGVTVESYEVTDLSGNVTLCSFSITVEDTSAPIFDCPENLVVPNDPGLCTAVVNFIAPTATDNCDSDLIPVQIGGPLPGSIFPEGISTITYEVTDLAGNTQTCSFNITVEDTELPEIVCPVNVFAEAEAGDCEVLVNYPPVSANDNCGVSSITLIAGGASGSIFQVGITTVTYEVSDPSGNTATCSFQVNVTEPVAPEITCPDNISVNTDPGSCGAIVNYDLPTATDNCGEATIALIEGPDSGSLFPTGSTDVVYQATDLSGNTTTCTFTVAVTDAELPVFDCPVSIILDSDAGICGAVYTFDPPTATDNCPENPAIDQTDGPLSGETFPIGTTTLSFTATDAAGNVATCTYDVTVEDNEPPTFVLCPEDISFDITDGGCTFSLVFDAPDGIDNCSVEVTQTGGLSTGAEVGPGVYPIAFTATDPSGNATVCAFQITVNDITPPVFGLCPESFSTCNPVVDFVAPTADDECSGEVIISQTEGLASGSTFPLGITAITFTATDASGNTTTCTFDVELLPNATIAVAGQDQNICDETSAILSGNIPDTGVGTWTLLEGSGIIQNPESAVSEVDGLANGENYFEWAINPLNGCGVLRDTVLITVEPGVTVDAGANQSILFGGQAILQAIVSPPGGSFLWDPGQSLSCNDCENPIANPSQTTMYFLTYTTPLGCAKIDSVQIQVTRDLPNTITPNDDGVNDVWNIPGIDQYPGVQVFIYNRWGSEVFQSAGYRTPWDGKNNGELLPTGSYFYVIDYQETGTENLNGTVNIIR